MEHKQIVVVGLGRMGGNFAMQLIDKGYEVFGYNRTQSVTKEFENQGLKGIYNYSEIKEKMSAPRVVWVMVPSGDAIEDTLLGDDGLVNFLEPGDYIVDAGNSFYKNTNRRYDAIESKGMNFVDVGFSGGPKGARHGACLMVGGNKDNFDYLEPLFRDTTVEQGYAFFEGNGAGHFVKMIHNGIEYGMMQSIAEGFTIMKESEFDLNLKRIADVYNHGSVIESSLMGWLSEGFEKFGMDLEKVSGEVGNLGEGKWTVDTAEEMGLKADVIKRSFDFRIESQGNPSYTGKILTLLRHMFGGHDIGN